VKGTAWRDVGVPPENNRPVYASEECEIDVGRRELRVFGAAVPVGGRAFEIIEVLAESAGALITKDELMNRIWPGAIVMENTLQVHAMAIRKALGPYRNLLKTESRRGYRLLGDWTVRRHDAARPPSGLRHVRVNGDSPVTNFPATVTHLVGRSAAIVRLQDLMSAYRMVTLSGPGGIGKSTLAMKVARRILGDYPDGGWLVELASLSDPTLVASTVAGVLGLRLGSTNIVPESVAGAIGDKKLLLVLDNCEHLVGAVASLAETLLARCPNVTVQATSRETLRIQGEHIFRVPSLDVPATDHMAAAQIMEHSAPELFVARATALGSDFASNTNYLSTIVAICRRLDGIPLAIELAAARAATIGLEHVAARLDERFALLTNGRRTALPRHRTLRATLDWSYQLLSSEEQGLLNCLAMFAGPFSVDAACAVAATVMESSEIASTVADLVGKSLVIKGTDPVHGELRLLETTRVYALDRLNESGAMAAVAGRHARYFLGLLGNVDADRASQSSDAYRAVSRRRADEIHVALEWAFSPVGDPKIGVVVTIAAVPLWFGLFQPAVACARLEQALLHAETGSDDEMRLRIAFGHAIWYGTPKSDAVDPPFARALEIAERTGATAVRIQALWGMWAARRGRGDYPAALEMGQRLADAADSAGDPGPIHLADRILGLTYHYLGDQTTARVLTERALRNPHHLDSSLGLGYQVETKVAMAGQLGRILWLQGFADQARAAAQDAVTAARKGEHPFAIVNAMAYASIPVLLWTGAVEEARQQVDELVPHTVGNTGTEPWRLSYAVIIRLRDGDEREKLIASFLEARVDLFSISSFAELMPNRHIPVPLPDEKLEQVLWNTPELLRVDAELLLWHDAPGAVTAAEAKLLRALEIAREQTALSWELRAAMSLAELWRGHGRAAEALDLLGPTYGKFTEGFGSSDLIGARRLIEDLASSRP
jgi:predicted ATPase/DNA-binding winged helix-turn-helix (wHTH) protein